MEIRGTAHPPPPRNGARLDPSDLTPAEIATTDVTGRPLLYEHDQGTRVGTCLASWEGRDGSLRIAAQVSDPETQAQIRSGKLRGLSLGTEMVQDTNGALVFKRQGEVSVCEEGRRAHTWIDTVGGQMVQVAACASRTKHTNEAFNALKADNERLRAENARERAMSSVFVDKEREKVQSFEGPAKWFFGEFLPEGEAQEVKSDLAPLSTWANEMAQKKDVLAQVSLARACHVASSKFKRMRDEASAGSEAKASLGKTMKENEELKADNSNKALRITELESLATERQQQAERLQAELAKHGLIAEKFNFSKLAAREEGAAHDAQGDVKMEGVPAATGAVDASNAAGKAPATNGALAGSVSNASRGAAGHSGNPFEGDSLAMMIASRGSGGLKMGASGTQHAFLGAQDSSGDLAALLKAR